MRAAFYEQQGPAADVLRLDELPDPEPGAGEVRVRLTRSGINPGDTKKRRGWLGSAMPYPRVIPHSDGAGVIDAVGDGVDAVVSAAASGPTGRRATGPSARPRSSPCCPMRSRPPCPTA